MKRLTFPKGFLWGTATSSHQVEGDTINNWSEWEKANAERLASESVKRFGWLPNWKEIEKEATDPANYISGKAVDHFNRYEEDFELAKELGHNSTCFSIEWSRIEPEEGKFNDEAIEHYRRVIQAIKKRNMTPFVTLWHWTHPVWLEERGGVESRDFPYFFTRYVQFVVSHFKDDVRFWQTLNEPTSVIGNGYIWGLWPPQKKSWWRALIVYWRLAQAHKKAFHTIHSLSHDAQVSFGNILGSFEPYHRHSPFDALAIFVARFFSNRLMLILTFGHHDFLTVHYYFHERIRFIKRMPQPQLEKNDLGWGIYPKGIYNILDFLKHFRLPIYITEIGLADGADTKREAFIRDHLAWVHKAIEEGADVRGHFYWSLLDNFEWDKGYWPKFGLIEVDRKTFARKIRPSARTYAEIAKSNSVLVNE